MTVVSVDVALFQDFDWTCFLQGSRHQARLSRSFGGTPSQTYASTPNPTATVSCETARAHLAASSPPSAPRQQPASSPRRCRARTHNGAIFALRRPVVDQVRSGDIPLKQTIAPKTYLVGEPSRPPVPCPSSIYLRQRAEL